MSNDVLVITEHLGGTFPEINFELLAHAREVAKAIGGRVLAAVLGKDPRPLAAGLGAADAALCVAHPALEPYNPHAWLRALAALVKERAPRLVLIGYTSAGMDLAAGLSVACELPLVAYCSGLRVEGGKLLPTSRAYGGKLLADVECAGDRCICAMLAGAAPADAGRAAGPPPSLEDVAPPAEVASGRTRFKALIQPEGGDVDITKADILVSIGRGIGGQENIELAQELADALGAAVAASRPLIDNGWLPKSRQVGKSGLTVKPKAYLAVGISGAPEHVEGMRDSALIIAINTDPQAPIFDVAHYGAVADLFDVLPALTERVKAAGG